jgi:hypothetical protein
MLPKYPRKSARRGRLGFLQSFGGTAFCPLRFRRTRQLFGISFPADFHVRVSYESRYGQRDQAQ